MTPNSPPLSADAADEAVKLGRLHSLPPTARFRPDEAALYLNVRMDLLRAWRSQRRGPVFEGRQHFIRYRKSDLDDFMSGFHRKVGSAA